MNSNRKFFTIFPSDCASSSKAEQWTYWPRITVESRSRFQLQLSDEKELIMLQYCVSGRFADIEQYDSSGWKLWFLRQLHGQNWTTICNFTSCYIYYIYDSFQPNLNKCCFQLGTRVSHTSDFKPGKPKMLQTPRDSHTLTITSTISYNRTVYGPSWYLAESPFLKHVYAPGGATTPDINETHRDKNWPTM